MKELVIVFGLSGSGKDTVANYLVERKGFNRIHPIADLKAHLETHYNLEPGSLDTPYRHSSPHSKAKTYQQMMVGLYHFWKEHDPEFTKPFLKAEAKRILSQKDGKIVAVALRNMHEVRAYAEVIDEVSHLGQDVIVTLIYVKRQVAKAETSDALMLDIIQSSQEVFGEITEIVDNNGTLGNLYTQINRLV